MKQLIRLTESDLHRIVKESVKKILREMDGAAMAGDSNGSGMSDPGEGGTTNTANVMQGGGTKPRKGTYDTSAGGKGGFWNDANDHTDMIRKSFEGK